VALSDMASLFNTKSRFAIAFCIVTFIFWTLVLSRLDVVGVGLASSFSMPFSSNLSPRDFNELLTQVQVLEKRLERLEASAQNTQNFSTIPWSTSSEENLNKLKLLKEASSSTRTTSENSAPSRTCIGVDRPTATRVQIVGPYNSGTNWLTTLIAANFLDINLCNGLPGYAAKFEPDVMWKHAQLNLLEESDRDMTEGNSFPEFERPKDRASTFFYYPF